MPNITDPKSIPASKRDTIKAVCERHGPNLLGDRYPVTTDADGNTVPKTGLTNAEAANVFEQITREFWRQQIEAEEVQQAAEAAAATARDQNKEDPFA